MSGRLYTSPGKGVFMKRSIIRRASMTVEAAFALPFFFLCMVMIICTLDLYGIYARKTVELQQRAEKIAAAASAGTAITGRRSPKSSGRAGGGTREVSGTGAGPSLTEGIIDIPGSVRFTPPGFAFHAASINLRCRGRVRAWIGYSGLDDDNDKDDGSHLVYVTDYESVYHTTSDCTHLDLTWEAAASSDMMRKKNVYGKHYHACEKCIGSGGVNNVVFISPQGDSYHNAASCSGLTRHVHLVKESEVSGLHKCSRCAAKERAEAAA